MEDVNCHILLFSCLTDLPPPSLDMADMTMHMQFETWDPNFGLHAFNVLANANIAKIILANQSIFLVMIESEHVLIISPHNRI